MSNLSKSFLICWLLMFSKGLSAQKKNSDLLAELKKTEYLIHVDASQSPVKTGLNSPVSFSNNRVVIQPSYVPSLGFFCRYELKLDKVAPMPVRVRLGSLDYVNWLEQKPNSRKDN